MDRVSKVGVVDKAIAVLKALSAGPLSLASLQDSTGLPRATAHRLAMALEDHSLVRRDSAGQFCLGFGCIALGQAATEHVPLAELARPVILALRDETGESAQLYVREGDARRCVLSFQSSHALRWSVPEGALLPLGRGSAGRVLGQPGASARRGWVESVEEREPGVASVSAPVVDSRGTVVAAVSVSGPLERLSRQPGRRFGPAVAAAARRIDPPF